MWLSVNASVNYLHLKFCSNKRGEFYITGNILLMFKYIVGSRDSGFVLVPSSGRSGMIISYRV